MVFQFQVKGLNGHAKCLNPAFLDMRRMYRVFSGGEAGQKTTICSFSVPSLTPGLWWDILFFSLSIGPL